MVRVKKGKHNGILRITKHNLKCVMMVKKVVQKGQLLKRGKGSIVTLVSCPRSLRCLLIYAFFRNMHKKKTEYPFNHKHGIRISS